MTNYFYRQWSLRRRMMICLRCLMNNKLAAFVCCCCWIDFGPDFLPAVRTVRIRITAISNCVLEWPQSLIPILSWRAQSEKDWQRSSRSCILSFFTIIPVFQACDACHKSKRRCDGTGLFLPHLTSYLFSLYPQHRAVTGDYIFVTTYPSN